MDKANLEKIVLEYEHVFNEKKYLYKPIENSSRLLILLSAHNQKTNYFLLRSFIENQHCNLLFLTDENNTWYLDDNQGRDYKEIISNIISTYELKNVYIFGSSMAGYGALHFALYFNIHCLSCNPQVNLKLSLDYSWQELSKNIEKTLKNTNNISIDKMYNTSSYDKVMAIVHGHAPIDVANVELILGSSASIRKLLVYTLDTDDHAMPFGREVDKIYQMLDLMASFDAFNLAYSDQNSQFSVLRFNRKRLVQENKYPHFRKLQDNYLISQNRFEWFKRFDINQVGTYTFHDIGYYTDKNELSGCLTYFDGESHQLLHPTFECIPIKYQSDLTLKNINTIENNQLVFDDCWARVNAGSSLLWHESYFSASFINSNNCYLNFFIPHSFIETVSDGDYITCQIEVTISNGWMTLSLGGVGEAGYYQNNKTISSSGVFTISTCIASINRNHSDALFARIYPLPDKKDKSFTVKSIKIMKGHIPLKIK